MPTTFLSEQKMPLKKSHGKLMKKVTSDALHRSKCREGTKKQWQLSFTQFCCLPVGKQFMWRR